ncbi:beta-galactosidase [Paenibacillus sp. IB182496]|uniref:Beta-galactosidase n=2 Tax=Paenibacillus sabuli TaxID=2772509 RepID=A0A927GSF8_9BACL|nr:beta-galactosidase [Paenibacillus sabuli]
MDAHIYPLLTAVAAGGREVAAPAVLLEHTKGAYSGGRWIFLHRVPERGCWQSGELVELLGDCATYCASGVTELWLKPSSACYEPGERAALTILLQTLGRTGARRGGAKRAWRFALQVRRVESSAETAVETAYSGDAATRAAAVEEAPPHNGPTAQRATAEAGERAAMGGAGQAAAATALWSGEARLADAADQVSAQLVVPVDIEPGLYAVECVCEAADGERRVLRQGYWGMDRALLQAGDYLRAGRDYFYRDGKPFPIVGMTYMTSDVARKFLLLPNVNVWERDMAQMKAAGINYVRTGIWTAYRQMMFIDGHPYDEVLRAIDAFFLTAKRHGLEVTFTFFSFAPEAWEGANPYLDPRSRAAQKRFCAAIVRRHADSTHVHWDLINEPSLFHPDRIFSGPQTVRDPYERQAYADWLRARHGDDIRELQARWNMTPEELPDFEAAMPPRDTDVVFKPTSIHPKKNAVWLDYTLFTMAMHNEWAADLTATIRAFQPRQLVTVGQDEGLCSQRPTPFFYGEAVDYTTVHSWWQLDHLVWDSAFTKTHGKPNLVQETGIMHVETPEGKSKRSEQELHAILERKYAYAFAVAGAGAVQWIWNTNYYMNNVNESNIGALRADGTEKPEAEVSYDFGAFIGGMRELFGERRLEEIAVVFPYSNDFSTRKLVQDATMKLSRMLSYRFKLPYRAYGEYQLDELTAGGNPPRLILVPSPHNFSREALRTLLNHVRHSGGTLLYTGPIGLDPYWRADDAAAELLGPLAQRNVRREEALALGDRTYTVGFPRIRISEVAKEVRLQPEEVQVQPLEVSDATAVAGERGQANAGEHGLRAAKGQQAAAPGAGQQDALAGGAAAGGRQEPDSQSHMAGEIDSEEGLTRLTELELGKGRLIWCPLPIELSESDDALEALYRHALGAAGVEPELEWESGGEQPGVYGRKLTMADGAALFTFVSESARPHAIAVRDRATGRRYAFRLPAERAVLFATRADGALHSVYRPDESQIDVE